MYIATNSHPSDWWRKNKEQHYCWKDQKYRAVARRFAKVHWWDDQYKLITLINPGVEPSKDSEEHPTWVKANQQWTDFWGWDQRPIREGDQWPPVTERKYYTLYNKDYMYETDAKTVKTASDALKEKYNKVTLYNKK